MRGIITIRCPRCGRRLFSISTDARGTAEIKCTKCGYIAQLELGRLASAALKKVSEEKMN
jgi:phage FluMu protein Com